MKSIFYKKTKGFTALEFIIATAIVVLITGISLSNLNTSRKNSRDQVKISNIKRIETGLANFRQVCGHYPSQLKSWSTCDKLLMMSQNLIGVSGGNKQLSDFIPDIDDFMFNDTTSKYYYVGIGFDSSLVSNPDCATVYHIGVRLEGTTSLASSDSQFDSSVTGIHRCYAQPLSMGAYSLIVSGFNGIHGSYDKLIQQ